MSLFRRRFDYRYRITSIAKIICIGKSFSNFSATYPLPSPLVTNTIFMTYP